MSERQPFAWAAVIAATTKTNRVTAFFELLSVPLSYVIVNATRLSANTVTRIGGVFGIAGSILFMTGKPLAAGFAYAAFLLLDCSDGAVARLRRTVSLKGADLDLWTDRVVLLTAVLSFSGSYAASNKPMAAWLCAGYLAAHYLTDLGWLMAERRRASLPPQFDDLKALLAVKMPVRSAVGHAWIRRIARLEHAIRPAPWLCNIVFLLGACLMPKEAGYSVAAALSLLLWAIAMPRIAYRLKRSMLAAA